MHHLPTTQTYAYIRRITSDDTLPSTRRTIATFNDPVPMARQLTITAQGVVFDGAANGSVSRNRLDATEQQVPLLVEVTWGAGQLRRRMRLSVAQTAKVTLPASQSAEVAVVQQGVEISLAAPNSWEWPGIAGTSVYAAIVEVALTSCTQEALTEATDALVNYTVFLGTSQRALLPIPPAATEVEYGIAPLSVIVPNTQAALNGMLYGPAPFPDQNPVWMLRTETTLQQGLTLGTPDADGLVSRRLVDRNAVALATHQSQNAQTFAVVTFRVASV